MRGFEEAVVTLRCVTPAFLGDASCASELRSPPFKALLRQWWRIAWTGGRKPDISAMREKEGRLFGHAWLEHVDDRGKKRSWASKSRIQISLLEWRPGDLKSWNGAAMVWHPEVGDGGHKVDAHLYLGYGPLAYQKEFRKTVLNHPPAISPVTRVTICLRYPAELSAALRLDQVLLLWHALGAIGSRHRNGWGSLMVCNERHTASPRFSDRQRLAALARRFEDCMAEDWCHAIGMDERGLLIWTGKTTFNTWGEALKELARVKIALRTSLPLAENKDQENPVIEKRHLLAYPVTNHGVREWSKTDDRGRPVLTEKRRLQQTMRLANQLYCKVTAESESSFRPWIAHLPHRLPRVMLQLLPERSRHFVEQCESSTWRHVHGVLDRQMQRWSME